MDNKNIQILKTITRHHCDRLRAGTIFLHECALVLISPSQNLIISRNVPQKLEHVSYEEHFTTIGTEFFHDGCSLPYVIIPWNYACQDMNEGLRKAWRFNFKVDYTNPGPMNNYLTYEIAISQELWLELIRWYRNRALEKLDIEFAIALEQSDDDGREEIGMIRQMLRDLPKEVGIEQYDTIHKLTSFWPTLLLPAPDFVGSVPEDIPDLDDIGNV